MEETERQAGRGSRPTSNDDRQNRLSLIFQRRMKPRRRDFGLNKQENYTVEKERQGKIIFKIKFARAIQNIRS
jgi:hypothetical protein